MHSNKLLEQPDRETLKRRYARLNWNAHLVPVVREAVADFGRTSWTKGHALPQIALRSETVCRGEVVGGANADLDALTVQFGVCPSGIALAPAAGYSGPLVAAGKAALVFAQADSGAVAVFLHPAGAPAATPRRHGDYRDPAELTRSRIRRLLQALFDMHCSESPRPAAAVVHSRRLPATGNYQLG